MKTKSNLERVLTEGHFAVTGECGPPRGADRDAVLKKGLILKGWVDAVNVTDNQTSIVRMSSQAASLILKSIDLDPVMQMVCRDRNRIAAQSDALGASALGINNLLCLTGDHQCFGNQPHAKNVFDLDSIQLLGAMRDMRDKKKFIYDDFEIKAPPKLFLGCAENPFGDPLEYRAFRLQKKVENGADFVQTQCIYNVKQFAKWMKQVRDLGLHKKVYILGGVTPLKSAGMAKYMRDKVAGMDVPDEVIDRLTGLAPEKAREEGIKICVETIKQLRKIEGVAGVHIMAIEWEDAVPQIVQAAGLSPRP